MDELYKLANGYMKHFPKGVEPYQMISRLLEECGEVASEVNLWENSGIKRQKHGEPKKENLAGEIKQVLATLLQIVIYYHVEEELCESVRKSLDVMEKEGIV